jgi:hypothetical protein
VTTFISGDLTRSQEAYRPWEGFTKPVFTLRDGKLSPQMPEDLPNPVFRLLDMHSSLWRVGRLAQRTFAHHFSAGEWWNLNAAVLDNIQADCRASGVPVLFVYIPTKEWQRFPTLEDYMRRTQENFIDMSAANRHPIPETTLPNGHLNALGNRIVADAILEWLDLHHRPELIVQISEAP